MPTNKDFCASDDETIMMNDVDTIDNNNFAGAAECHHFEGPEKRLEIDFKNLDPIGKPEGLRAISQQQWQVMLDFAKCTIISHKDNEFFDAFVLSESSLFVYPEKIMIKTCGTTTLLNCIPKILEYSQTCDMIVQFVTFSRKNYMCPHRQIFPHTDWSGEVQYLNSIFEGQAYVLGPVTSEHWYIYVADYTEQDEVNTSEPEQTLEIMMHHLDRERAEHFYIKEGIAPKDKHPFVQNLIPGYETDEFNFSPCGYSMNGLFQQAYSTIHVTPEPHCSYASFETNLKLASYNKLVNAVLNIFKPGNFTVTVMHEKSSFDSDISRESCLDLNIPGYVKKHKTVSEVEGNCHIIMIHYESTDFASCKKKKMKKIIYPVIPVQDVLLSVRRNSHTPLVEEEMRF